MDNQKKKPRCRRRAPFDQDVAPRDRNCIACECAEPANHGSRSLNRRSRIRWQSLRDARIILVRSWIRLSSPPWKGDRKEFADFEILPHQTAHLPGKIAFPEWSCSLLRVRLICATRRLDELDHLIWYLAAHSKLIRRTKCSSKALPPDSWRPAPIRRRRLRF
jgi:hypothetical protein